MGPDADPPGPDWTLFERDREDIIGQEDDIGYYDYGNSFFTDLECEDNQQDGGNFFDPGMCYLTIGTLADATWEDSWYYRIGSLENKISISSSGQTMFMIFRSFGGLLIDTIANTNGGFKARYELGSVYCQGTIKVDT